MSEINYRFGSFFVDRAGYRVSRDDAAVVLTPKLLDLLLHLLDNAGILVTKEQLLDALWPGANVTENALAQAVSELRQAIGDDAASPRFIKTVARRGYRFIAPVERIAPMAARASVMQNDGQPTGGEPAIAVMDFTNVTGEADCEWLSAGIAETVTRDLRALGRFRVVDRGRVMEVARRTDGSLASIAAELGVPLSVVGSYQRTGDRIRIIGRVVNVSTGEALADAKVDGPLGSIFDLQDRIVAEFSQELGFLPAPAARRSGTRETASLEAYRAFTEGWLQLETLDVREIPRAIAKFERAVQLDRRYTMAYTGLASAQLAAYESTRSDNVPAHDVLQTAIGHARTAVAFDELLADAHATLALLLVSAWQTVEAVQSARRAVAIEPTNWRHFFRLGHASWGEERLRAAANTLALYPDFAFAHFQSAMVRVARGQLNDAEAVLRQGAAVQDRQIGRGERYPALGLHWLLGLVRLAQHDADEALREFDRERELADPHRLYGREFAMNALHARGACFLRMERSDEAIESFRQALALYPDHAQSHLGLALAFGRTGSSHLSDRSWAKVSAVLATLAESRPIEAAMVRSQILAAKGDRTSAGAALCKLLSQAPPGFAAWTAPIEPLLGQLTGATEFATALSMLANRAR